MFLPAWLALFAAVGLIVFWKRLQDAIAQYLRIRSMINKLPGPPTVPLLGNAYNLQWDAVEFTFQMEYLFRKYAYTTEDGVIRFWLGPVPVVFLCRPKSVKAVLESRTLLWKPPEYLLFEPIWGSGLITSSGPKWHERRRMLTPAFHFTILQSYLTVFNTQAKVCAFDISNLTSTDTKQAIPFIHQLTYRPIFLIGDRNLRYFHLDAMMVDIEKDDKVSEKTLVNILDKFVDTEETFDLLPYLRRFSMDTISETAMGVSVNAQKGENEDFYVGITRIFEMVFKKLRYPWLWITPLWYALGYGFEFDRHVKVARRLVSKVIAERTKEYDSLDRKPTFEELPQSSKRKLAFLDLLLSMRHEHKLTESDIMEEVGTFLVAGYDTVSSSVGFVLFLIGLRQHIQDKVYEELYDIFGDSDREITVDDLKRMEYLGQCMKEAIRMYPTVVMIGRRITEDTVVGSLTIPAGVTASVSPFSVARDPEQWKDPEVFDPDRFSPENSVGRDPFAFLPFSAGPRNCLGQKFATMEEKVALAYILRKYRVVSMVTEEENRSLPEVSLKPSRGFPTRLQSRL